MCVFALYDETKIYCEAFKTLSSLQPKKSTTSDEASRANWPWIYYAKADPTLIT